tara:strand:+ start:1402 stop:1605 length:204 start_codon:yes stop_codon:yes gene_type:complete
MKGWVTQKEMADYLGVGISTLFRWREQQHLEMGEHYRRKTPDSRTLLYNVEKTEQRIAKLCSTPLEV